MDAHGYNGDKFYTVTLDSWQLVALRHLTEACIEGKPMPDIHKQSLQATIRMLESAKQS